MINISEKRRIQIECIAMAVTANLFASMCNPKFRGHAFTWAQFPDMARGMCKKHYPLTLNKQFKETDIWAEECAKFGKNFAERLIKEANFHD